MNKQLETLIEFMPPPQHLHDHQINWHAVEEVLGLKYPTSFKEFISVYGASKWFDYFSPFYLTSNDEVQLGDFRKTAAYYLDYLKDNILTSQQKGDYIPQGFVPFPEAGCYFPFMIDEGSNFYFWKTDMSSPEDWPIIIGPYGELNILENMSITEMFLSYLNREPPMFDIWGDINDVPPEEMTVE